MVRIFLITLLCFAWGAIHAQSQLLRDGDSLFNQQKYTQAFEKYEEIFQRQNQSSPAMLLKMAFIQDGSGDYADALYFLNKYYQQTADRQVISKINELAETNDLSGYSYDDIDYFLALMNKYQFLIIMSLCLGMLVVLAYSIWKRKKSEKSVVAFIISLCFIIGLFMIVNIKPSPKGVVIADQTLLRSGPSAGAEPIDAVAKGHRVNVVTRDEIWTKIVWNGEEVYVRNGKLKII